MKKGIQLLSVILCLIILFSFTNFHLLLYSFVYYNNSFEICQCPLTRKFQKKFCDCRLIPKIKYVKIIILKCEGENYEGL